MVEETGVTAMSMELLGKEEKEGKSSQRSGQSSKYLTLPNQTIYRMQDNQGVGPWKPGFSIEWIEERDDLPNLKSIMEEFNLSVLQRIPPHKFIGCGCRSQDQLRRWFTPYEYLQLYKNGYCTFEIRHCTIVCYSDLQCIFFRDKPLNLSVKPIALYKKDELPSI